MDPAKHLWRVLGLTPSHRHYSEVLLLFTCLACSRAEQNIPSYTPNYVKCAWFLGFIANEIITVVLLRLTKTFWKKMGLCWEESVFIAKTLKKMLVFAIWMWKTVKLTWALFYIFCHLKRISEAINIGRKMKHKTLNDNITFHLAVLLVLIAKLVREEN